MKFLIIYKKYIYLSLCAVLCLVLLSFSVFGTPVAAVFFGYAPRIIPIYSVATDEKKVAISFDSAWGADKTEKIVQILKEHDVDATFFLVGFWVEKHPDMVKMLQDNDIEIGTHSNTHPDLTKLSSEQIKLELETSINSIKQITGEQVNLFRAPFGAYNNNLLTITEELGLKTIQWDVDTLDWKGISGLEICERVMARVKNGSIILCHNNADHILDALPAMLIALKNAGYQVTSIGNLIYDSDYTIDHAGTQHKN